jgi:hypothetical protein
VTILIHLASVLLQGSLALFPPGYRREYGEEHACVLRLALAEAAGCGGLPLLHFIAREGRDLPLALFQAHQKEWKVSMNGIRQFTLPPGDALAGRQTLWFLLPFLVALVASFEGLIPVSFIAIPAAFLFLGLLALVLVVAIAGIFKSLPLWALPSLGLVISLFNLVLLYSLSPNYTPGLSELKEVLWTGFMPGRVLYALIANIYSMAPGILLLAGVALLSTRLPALSAFRQRLGRDWTLLPLVVYTSNLITPFFYDPYRGREPYMLLFHLILLGGVWLYLRGSRAPARLAALLVATLLSGLVLSLAVYLLYPQQGWVISGTGAGFPRWWETLGPLLGTLVFLAALGLMAAFGSGLSQGARPEMASPEP